MKHKLIDTTTINDLFTNGGIFKKIYAYDQTLTTPVFDWLTADFALITDKEYYLSHSGGKWVSGLYERMYKAESDGVIADALLEIAKIIHQKFALSWNKIYDALTTNYRPLENYDMEQTETPNITHTKNVKQSITTTNDVYGFNSVSKVPQSESNVSGDKLNNEETDAETGTRGLTRHGNIGVTTNQQMLIAEVDLRTQNHFMNIIMDDVDSILCLLAY